MSTEQTEAEPDPNTFAGRRAAREAEGRPAATPYRPSGSIRVGDGGPSGIVVTRVNG